MGVWMIRIAVLYFLLGSLMGILIHATPELRFVHPHWNLLGWVSLALAGIIYSLFPKAGKSKLGKLHFWFHIVGIPLLSLGLFFSGMGLPEVPYAPLGGLLIVVGVLLFTINVFIHVKSANLLFFKEEN